MIESKTSPQSSWVLNPLANKKPGNNPDDTIINNPALKVGY